jgi:hypothetical protein
MEPMLWLLVLAGPHDSAPKLPPPAGSVVNVGTVDELERACRALRSGTTLLIKPGTYKLRNTLQIVNVENVTVRGATDGKDDVVIAGEGMDQPSKNVPHGFWVSRSKNVTIANLTIRDTCYHCVAIQDGSPGARLYNLRLLDAGEQHVKVNPNPASDDGAVEYCVIEYTTTCNDNYCNGVDVHQGARWRIRHNLFRNIRGNPKAGMGGPAILMWRGAKDTITEGNLFLNCERGIAYGLENKEGDHSGGIIRNNIFYRAAGQSGDAAVVVWGSPGTQVLGNTLILSGTYPDAIDYRFASSRGLVIANNLTDAKLNARDGATAELASNVTDARPEWFADAAKFDLRLTNAAAGAMDRGRAFPDLKDDWESNARGARPDVGAFEFLPKKPGKK